MSFRFRNKLLGYLLLACLTFGLAASTRADSPLWTQPKPGPGTSGNDLSSDPAETPIYIYLAAQTFDPLLSLPNIPTDLAYSVEETGASGTYILQLTGPVQEAWKTELINLGAKLGNYIPDYAFLVYMQPEVKAEIQRLPYVRWVGPYQPAYKLSPHVDFSGERSYRINLAPWADAASLERDLSAIDANQSIAAGNASAVLDGESLRLVARLPQVIWIEPVYLNRLNNNIAAGTIMGGSAAWSSGFTGSDNTIAVTDSGLDTGNPDDIHPDFSGRVTHISSWPVQGVSYGNNCYPQNVGSNDGAADKDSGHGSHVTGSLAGNGSASGGQFKGLAYQADITFQAVEQWTNWPDEVCPLVDGYWITGIPTDLHLLLNEVYAWGARVQNYSWGGGDSGHYDAQASQVDDFVFDHPDLTLLVSAGNSGIDGNKDGYTDADSIGSPGVAKNLITIGASDNERHSGGLAAYTWFQLLGDDFSVNPSRSDYTSDDASELAAFSSRGPVDDGRIKPDLVAPGTNIISVRSSQASGTGWGTYNAYYMYDGGTSMSSPLAAGAATLVRDYYRTAEGLPNPSAALIKATLINSAVDITGYEDVGWEAGQPLPNMHEGWGLINVGAATTTGKRQFFDQAAGLGTGASDTYYFNLSPSRPLKVTLAWSDYPGSPGVGKALVNDLNLRLTAPNGTTYWGNQFLGGWSRSGGLADSINNVENVYIQVPTLGTWKVEIIGQNVPENPQAYALIVDGEIGLKDPLEVTSITPTHAFNNAILSNAIIQGAGFVADTSVHLEKGLQTIVGSGVIVDLGNNRITADFNLTGAAAGWWDVVLENPGETAILEQGFFVKDASLPDLAIEKIPLVKEIDPGSTLTYKISIENGGFVTTTAAIFTDTLPAGVEFVSLAPECEGGVVSLPDGFACTVLPLTLTAGASVDYSLVVTVPEDLNGFLVNQVEVTSQGSDAYLLNNQSTATVLSGVLFYYLPQTMKHHSSTPSAPLLLPIENSDRDGSYTVTWQPGSGPLPTSYDLSENDALILNGFGGYTHSLSGKAEGSYTYQVRGKNAQGSGPWSEAQSVTVGVPPGIILNGDLENGPDGSWTEESSNDLALILDSFSPNTVTPHGGQWGVWLGGWEDEQSAISQNINVPTGKSLSFWYWSTSEETSCGLDIAYVMIDQEVIAEIKLCDDFETNQWTRRTLDLSAYAGTTVNLKFILQTNGLLNSNLFLDDVNFE